MPIAIVKPCQAMVIGPISIVGSTPIVMEANDMPRRYWARRVGPSLSDGP
jgi:hypothetical protein